MQEILLGLLRNRCRLLLEDPPPTKVFEPLLYGELSPFPLKKSGVGALTTGVLLGETARWQSYVAPDRHPSDSQHLMSLFSQRFY